MILPSWKASSEKLWAVNLNCVAIISSVLLRYVLNVRKLFYHYVEVKATNEGLSFVLA